MTRGWYGGLLGKVTCSTSQNAATALPTTTSPYSEYAHEYSGHSTRQEFTTYTEMCTNSTQAAPLRDMATDSRPLYTSGPPLDV
jgi:hypothetical protein